MEEKCGGLPLAIVVIGGVLMGRERTPDEWSKVDEMVSWYLSQDSNQCRQILTLSYSDLPYYLKPCFLYLSIFPEDSRTLAWRLIRLWIAEGFVDARRQVSMEAVAQDYLEELVQRSLIQVTYRSYLGGPVWYFQVHDLLRDLAIAEGRNDRFIEVCNNNNPATSTSRPRRLAIHSSTTELREVGKFCISTPPNLRCLSLTYHGLPTFPGGNKMLRVLNIEDEGTWKDIGKGIGDLIFLQYLRIDDRRANHLSSSIGNLVKLQTLDIQHTCIRVLPRAILKLKNLRHLLVPINYCEMVKGIVGITDFGRNIHTLKVSGHIWINKNGTGLSEVLVKHRHLCILQVRGELAVNNDSKNLKNCFPSTLTDLKLFATLIKEDPSDVLGSLPTLKALSLFNLSYTGRELVFSSGRFQRLLYLNLDAVNNLSEWRVEDGSIPILRHLRIRFLKELIKLPDGLRKVTTLQRMEVFQMPQLEERIKENGEDWEIVKHIAYRNF